MKIQKRYIDKATEMMDSWYEAIDQYDNMVNELAVALARIANEAAWDVKLNQPDESTYEWVESKYGPRPSRGEVGHE